MYMEWLYGKKGGEKPMARKKEMYLGKRLAFHGFEVSKLIKHLCWRAVQKRNVSRENELAWTIFPLILSFSHYINIFSSSTKRIEANACSRWYSYKMYNQNFGTTIFDQNEKKRNSIHRNVESNELIQMDWNCTEQHVCGFNESHSLSDECMSVQGEWNIFQLWDIIMVMKHRTLT